MIIVIGYKYWTLQLKPHLSSLSLVTAQVAAAPRDFQVGRVAMLSSLSSSNSELQSELH